jgi:regulation of enolase protein 1 (concanavalin A-like superfamily)
MRVCLLILWGLVAASVGGAATIQENFSSDPQPDGWKIFGDTNLFHWDSTNQNLAVTWDSSQSNSYFYHALGTILARDDSFHLSFDLTFQDYTNGTTSGKPYDFEAAIGFLNLTNATQTNFSRGAGINTTYGPDNLVEFDFFPAFSIYQPTISQVIVSTNNAWLYNNSNLLGLTPGQWFHVEVDYSSATRMLTTVVTNNGVQYGMTQTISVPTNFDFRVTAISVSSYSDQNATGSILAHGIVDNLVVTGPPPPVQDFTGSFTNGAWQTQFLSRSNWLYTLQRSADFQSWTNVSSTTPGNATNLFLQDTGPPGNRAFYRISAQKP